MFLVFIIICTRDIELNIFLEREKQVIQDIKKKFNKNENTNKSNPIFNEKKRSFQEADLEKNNDNETNTSPKKKIKSINSKLTNQSK